MSTNKNNFSIKITTPKQFDKLVELMEKNPHLGRGFSKGLQKFNIKDEWNKIGEELNALGPPIRNADGWLKVWSDYKCKLKKKLIHNKSECRATGGGPNKQFTLTANEEAAASFLQLHSIINPAGKTFGGAMLIVTNEPEGYNADVSLTEESFDNVIDKPSTSQPLPKKKQNISEKNNLLEQQLKVQSELYTDIKRSLTEIERYARKTFKLKEEKLRLYKEELKRKEDNRKVLIKCRLDEIEIKKRNIELEELKSKF